ncbi:MAG: T9SS type A sorting domain-containing protein [bacterium]|nr:T9SS type A sorting domain-containing protein [bacterium]
MKKVWLVVLMGVVLLNAAPTVDGTVDPQNEGYTLVAENPENTDKAGADLLAFYYAIANDSLYLAITTQNTNSWDVAYGFSLDVAEGGYVGDPVSDIRDSWGRLLYFPSWNPDYQIYFWYSGADQAITSVDFNRYSDGSWGYDFASLNYYATTGESGLQALEVAVALTDIGNPTQVLSCAYIVGGDNSSAVDILPYDSSVSLTGGEEWTDWDAITTYFVLNVREGTAKFSMQPILNGVRVTGFGNYVLEVYTVDGKKVMTRKVAVNGRADVIFNLKPGLYLVREGKLGTSKFIVAK